MTKVRSGTTGTVGLSEFTDGLNVVQGGTPLKFVNYFDGMLMRAELMKLEQRGMHSLSQLSNQAGGHGVVWGYDTALADGSIKLGAGMAINLDGQVVVMPSSIELDIDQLLKRAERDTPSAKKPGGIDSGFVDCLEPATSDPVTVIEGTQYYVITVDHLGALCGEEDVYGRLCEEACITATDRPYQIHGVVVRAEPLPSGLVLPQSAEVTLSGVHTRSRIASAFFEYEQNMIASHISGEGLAQNIWCNGARLPGGYTRGVPIALLARNGSENLFLDRWIVTRERMESPPRRYWAHIMAMRPWNMFLAQVLQFQCQLNKLFGPDGGPSGEDPCANTKKKIKTITDELQALIGQHQSPETDAGEAIDLKNSEWLNSVKGLEQRLRDSAKPSAPANNRILINGGIVETPSAGYLPIKVDDTLSVEKQVRALMGEGVDLRFCVVRPDYIPHALEEAQHMERISLLEGLDNPDAKPKVDVLVPDGFFQSENAKSQGNGYAIRLDLYEIIGELFDFLLEGNDKGKASHTKEAQTLKQLGAERMRFALDEISAMLSQPQEEAEPVAMDSNASTISKARKENQVRATTNGAARGTDTPSGGYAFYYAGSATLSSNDDARSKVHKLVEVESLAAASQRLGTGSLAIWTSMSLEKDPSNLSIGQSTTARLEVDLALIEPGSDIEIKRLRLDANFSLKVTDSSPANIGLHVNGELRIRMDEPSIGSHQENSLNLNNSSRIRKLDSGLNQSTIVSLLAGAIFGNRIESIISQRAWVNDQSAKVRIGLNIPDFSSKKSMLGQAAVDVSAALTYMLAEADQTIDQNVFKADHPAHESSIEALELISTVADRPDLAAQRAQLLFDAEQGQSLSNKVFATRDWAFFHRRRDKQCEAISPEVVQPERGYRVYAIELAAIEDLSVIMQLIRDGDWDVLTQFKASFITEVAFNGGTPNMLSSRVRVLSDWQAKADKTTEILSGVIVNNPQWSEPGTLAGARISQLNSVIDDVSEIDDQAQFEATPILPPQLAETDLGGIVYLVRKVTSSCQRVVRFAPSDDPQVIINRLKVGIENGVSIDALLSDFQAQNVGIQGFKGTTAEPLKSDLEALLQSWNQLGNGPVSALLNITRTTAEQNSSLAQGNAIAKAINGSDIDSEHVLAPQWFGDCQGVTALFAGSLKDHQVFRSTSVITPETHKGLQSVIVRTGIQDTPIDGWVAEAPIRFNPESELISDAEIAARYQSILNTTVLNDGVEWHVVTAHQKGAVDSEIAAIKSQSEKIGALLNPNPQVQLIENKADRLPNGADAITFLVPVNLNANFSTMIVSVAQPGRPVTESEPAVAFRFTPDEELIRGEHFEAQIKELKRQGIQFSEAEMFGEAKPRANDKRLSGIVEALKAEGILKPDAVKMTSKLKVSEDSALNFGSFRLPEAMVLRRS
jgi:hypothetical protein